MSMFKRLRERIRAARTQWFKQGGTYYFTTNLLPGDFVKTIDVPVATGKSGPPPYVTMVYLNGYRLKHIDEGRKKEMTIALALLYRLMLDHCTDNLCRYEAASFYHWLRIVTRS